jgi:hypothetical protein
MLVSGSSAALARDSGDPSQVSLVSLVSLIATPAAYQGRRIQVAGYLTTAHFEDCALYLSRDDFDRGITTNAIRVRWKGCLPDADRRAHPESLLRGQFATVEGTFRDTAKSSTAPYAGEVYEISRIEPRLSRKDFLRGITIPWWQNNWFALALGLLIVVAVTTTSFWITRMIQARR